MTPRCERTESKIVIAGLDPAIHQSRELFGGWMPGSSPGMTMENASGIKHDDAAQGLARLHVGKALVDLGQLQLGRDPVFQVQPSAQVELDQPRHVDAEMIGAHRRALDLALAQEVEAVQLDLLA